MVDFQDQATTVSVDRPSGLSYLELLRWDVVRAGSSPKRRRTQRRLLAATAEVLQRDGLERLRVAEVAAVAGVSPATFYVYFTDRTDIADRVLRGFCDYVYACEPRSEPPAGLGQVRQRISALLALAQDNGGLLRALGQAILMSPQIADHVRRRRADWIAATMAEGQLIVPGAWRAGSTEVLDTLIRGVLDRFASPPSEAGASGPMADLLAGVWLSVVGRAADGGAPGPNCPA